jgi:hypothetical protein
MSRFVWVVAAGILGVSAARADFPDFPADASMPDAYRYTLQADVTGVQKGRPLVRKEKIHDKVRGDFKRAFARRADSAKPDARPRVAVLFLSATYCSSCEPKESFDPVGQLCGGSASVMHLVDDEVSKEDSGVKLAYPPGQRPSTAAGLFVYTDSDSGQSFGDLRRKLYEKSIPGQSADAALPAMIVVVDGKIVARVAGCLDPSAAQAAIERAVGASRLPGTDQWKCQ